MIVFVTEGE